MNSFLVRRLLGAVATVLVVSFVAYVALTFAPGDAAQALVGENASAEQIAALRVQMKLDAPLLERYGDYMAGAVRGDLGRSLISDQPVGQLLIERFPMTIELALAAIGLATVFGFALGHMAALKAGSKLDLLVVGTTALALSLPSYWVALLLVMLFSLTLHWLPVFGSGTIGHLVLPAVTLALPAAAMIARLVRAGVVEIQHSDFVRTAVAKGLSHRQTMARHVLPNALIPALTMLGLNLSHLIGGAFVVETIFAWPGLGRLMVQAIFDRDIPVVMGTVLVVAPLCLATNLLVDLLHGALDPRVRQQVL